MEYETTGVINLNGFPFRFYIYLHVLFNLFLLVSQLPKRINDQT